MRNQSCYLARGDRSAVAALKLMMVAESESEKDPQEQEQTVAAPQGVVLAGVSGEFPASPELMVTALRAGSVLIVLFQTAYLFLDMRLPVGVSMATLPLHLTNIATGAIGFFMAMTPFGRRHWRMLTLWAVTVVLFSTTALSVISGRNEPFYLSVILMVTGAAALLPWESRWQASLNGVALAMMVIQTVRVPDDGMEIHWLTGMIALGLAQASVIINENYRRAIDKARLAALEASEAKSGFLSSMSHEIRTPMNAIVGLAEVLGETPLTNEQRRYVNTMFANGKSLLELINNILDLAKIESGRFSTVDEQFDVADLCETVAESLALRAHEKNLELTVWVDPAVPQTVIGDPLRVRQIIVNLLGNAVKFTEFGKVSLSVDPVPTTDGTTQICFTVSDTGIGIPEEKLDAVFQVFTQLDSSASRRHEGSGLGLTIVNRLLELLGGKLSVQSEILKGSSFSATVPFALPETSEAPQPRPDLGGVRILIVDDNAASLAILSKIVRSLGGMPDICSSASEAVAAIENAAVSGMRYALLMVDSKMPNVGGVELVKALRDRNDITPAILMLTSDELHARFDRMKEAGLKHYIVKPAKRSELFRTLQEALAGEVDLPNQVEAATSEASPMLSRTARILLAEDNPGNRMLVKAFLKGGQFEIDEAENGAIAVNKFTTRKYDIVLMDMYMPVVDGYEATAAIRKWEKDNNAPRTPVVALTAAAMSGDMERSLDAGCDFHVTKPVSKSVLLNLLESLLKGRPEEAPASKPYDVAAELSDPELFAEVSQLFLDEMDRLMETIDRAFADSDFKKLGDYVHSLKGSAAMVGAKPIAALCKDIENAIKNASMDEIKRGLAALHLEQPRAREVFGKKTEPMAQAS
jgi:signal transduction histidine kinase/CheY-like chemotaxis protein/HPt (histidine-containing phosphotransfer) domain-containing protein